MLLQERSTRFVETLCFFAKRNVDRLGRRELSGFLENSGLRMNLDCGTKQQVLYGWMQVRAHGKTSLWCQQYDIRGWTVNQKIHDTGGEHQFIQERVKREV